MSRGAALIIGAALIVCGYLLQCGLRDFRSAARNVAVRGFAERPIKANHASWRIDFSVRGDSLENATAGYTAAKAKLKNFLEGFGLGPGEIKSGIPRASENLERTSTDEQATRSYLIQDWVTVSSGAVDKIALVASQTSQLLAQGVFLSGYEEPRFYFTGLSDLKPQMISEAMHDGKKGAGQFASDSGCKLGEIQSASQGLFTIRGAVEGAEESTQIEKVVRVVVSLDYRLAECG